MYVAIRLYDGVKNTSEVATKVRDEFLPIISKIAGFQEYYAVKSGDDTMASISVFKDKPGAEEAVKVATKWVETNMSRLLPNPPKMVGGETVAHTSMTTKVAA